MIFLPVRCVNNWLSPHESVFYLRMNLRQSNLAPPSLKGDVPFRLKNDLGFQGYPKFAIPKGERPHGTVPGGWFGGKEDDFRN